MALFTFESVPQKTKRLNLHDFSFKQRFVFLLETNWNFAVLFVMASILSYYGRCSLKNGNFPQPSQA